MANRLMNCGYLHKNKTAKTQAKTGVRLLMSYWQLMAAGADREVILLAESKL